MNLTLTDILGKGGEATVYTLAEKPNLVAKIYHNPTADHEAKLRAMLLNPPKQPATHIAIAWPVALLYQQDSHLYTQLDHTTEGQFVGFLMPKITGKQAIFHMYNPVLREQLSYPFNGRALHRTAANLCAVVSAIHAKGYVIGDLNESNILVNREALVTIVDCDSFQVVDKIGHIYRCPVGKPEYTPPELQGADFKDIDQTTEHDLFGLGVLLFQLLMEGYHPFTGVLQQRESVGRVDLYAMRKGLFPYQQNSAILPPPSAPPYIRLHTWLQKGFIRCFVEGHQKPTYRLTANQWAKILRKAEVELTICSINTTHVYPQTLTTCPQCTLQKAKQHAKQTSTIHQTLINLFRRINADFNTKLYSFVIKDLTEVIQLRPQATDAYLLRAWIYCQKKQFAEAKQDVEQAFKLNNEEPLAYYLKGILAMEQGRSNEAYQSMKKSQQLGYKPIKDIHYQLMKWGIEQYNWLSIAMHGADYIFSKDTSPTYQLNVHLTTLYEVGLEAYQNNDIATVEVAMGMVINIGIPFKTAFGYLAWAAYHQQKYDQAMMLFAKKSREEIFKPIPDLPQMIAKDIVTAYHHQQEAQVWEATSALILYSPLKTYRLLAIAYLYRAWAYYRRGDYWKAIKDYNKMLVRAGYLTNEKISYDINDLPQPNVIMLVYQEAEKAYQQLNLQNLALSLKSLKQTTFIPHNCLVYQALVDSKQQRYKTVIILTTEFINRTTDDTNPLRGMAYLLLGQAYRFQKKYHLALEALEQAVQYGVVQAYWERAILHQTINNSYNLILADLEQYLAQETDPNKLETAHLWLNKLKRGQASHPKSLANFNLS